MHKKHAKDSETLNHEIIIGLVAGVGTDIDSVVNELKSYFSKTKKYDFKEIRVTNSLNKLSGNFNESTERSYEKISNRIEKCNELCRELELNEAMSILSMAQIREIRKNVKSEGAVYVINQLKRPDEVKLFRKVYGKNFVLIALYEHKHERKKRLLSFWGRVLKRKSESQKIDELINRDEDEGIKYGQEMRKAFVEADFFIDIENLKENVKRFSEIVLGYPYYTPSRDELNMTFAWVAAMRSADMSRQVGAVIATEDGDLNSLGCNELPKFGGGLIWENDEPDYRDFQRENDYNHIKKEQLIKDAIKVISKVISSDLDPVQSLETLKDQNAEILNIIEYCRAVHAEDAAICDAARRGIHIEGKILYSTTFPCHLCTKHIIAVGIKKVIYIYPYDKSKANEMYNEVININPGNGKQVHGKIEFKHFMGVAPRKFLKVFYNAENRKNENGQVINWNIKDAFSTYLRNRTPLAYYDKETAILAHHSDKFTPYIGEENLKGIFLDAVKESKAMDDVKRSWLEREIKL